MDDETSTATHVDICKHCVWQSVSDTSGCNVPPSDTMPPRRCHVSHPAKVKHKELMDLNRCKCITVS